MEHKNNTLWKFTHDVHGVDMPIDAEILKVDFQHGYINYWVLCNPENETIKRFFEVYYTGDTLRYKNAVHLETLQRGELVYHVFETFPEAR